MDCKFSSSQGFFNFRAAGVFVHNGRLLAITESNLTHYYLPGGRVRLHETMEDALCREVREELHTGAKILRPLWLCESFFSLDGTPVHELAMYYLAQLQLENLPSLTGSFTLTDTDGAPHIFTWLTPEEVRAAAIYPLVLKESFPQLPERFTLITDTRDRIAAPDMFT